MQQHDWGSALLSLLDIEPSAESVVTGQIGLSFSMWPSNEMMFQRRDGVRCERFSSARCRLGGVKCCKMRQRGPEQHDV